MILKKIIMGLTVVVLAIFSLEFLHSKEGGGPKLKHMLELQQYQGQVVYFNPKDKPNEGKKFYRLLEQGKFVVLDFSELGEGASKKSKKQDKVKKHKKFTSELLGVGLGLTQNLALVFKQPSGRPMIIYYGDISSDDQVYDEAKKGIRELHSDIREQIEIKRLAELQG